MEKISYKNFLAVTKAWLDTEERLVRKYLLQPKTYEHYLYAVSREYVRDRLMAQVDLPAATYTDDFLEEVIAFATIKFGKRDTLPKGIVLASITQFNKPYQYLMIMPILLRTQMKFLTPGELQNILDETGFDLTGAPLSRTLNINHTPALVISTVAFDEIFKESRIPRLTVLDGDKDFSLFDKMKVRNSGKGVA